MPGPNAPYTNLDANQVLTQSFEEANDRLRVDAVVTATIGDVTIDASTSSVEVKDPLTNNSLHINADGSINTDVILTAAADSISSWTKDGVGNSISSTAGALNVNISGGSASNPSVGTIGATAPSYATELGAVDANGKLQSLLVDPVGKLLVDITGSSTITGTVNANIEGLNSFQTSQYTIGTSAVQLTVTPLTNRTSMSIKALTTGTNTIYVGNSSGVTTSSGYVLFNGDSIQLDLTPNHVIYAIATAAAQTIYVLEIGT